MSAWKWKINWNHWMRLKVLALALVSLALFAGPASAKPFDNGGAQFTLNTSGTDPYLQDWAQVQSELAYQTSTSTELSSGGVTPTNLARAYVPRSDGGVTPTNMARAYAPRSESVAASVSGRSFELGDAALGFGLGLLLTAVCAVAIVHSRRGMRMAHS